MTALPDMPLFLVLVIFIAILFLVQALYLIWAEWFGGDRRAVNRRLRLLASGRSSAEILNTLRRRRREGDGSVAATVLGGLDARMAAAGMNISTPRFLLIIALAVIGIGLALSYLVVLPPGIIAVVAVILGIGLPWMYLGGRAKRRLAKLGDQLPEAIDMIVRSLRAGHPVNTAIGMVGREMADPIGTEFGLVFDEMTYGLDLKEALENLAQRVAVPDLHYLVVAVRVQFNTGGNLAEILASLSRVIRDRVRMHHRVRALSAEGRMSAGILSALPFVLGGVIFMMRPKYYLDAMADPAFLTLISFGLAGIASGIFVMYRIVNFKF